ncbi:MAG TPA: tetratricopeptide repeat protein [Blastocatellia bacterium]|nr:tetratricopeptide repeat protein [Blastocatellia bacterium]
MYQRIAKYQEVLAEDPNDAWAIYELAFTYSAMKDYRKSLETAYQGVEYKYNERSRFFVLIGNDLDQLGEHEGAIRAYRAGLEAFPDNAELYYNLAVTYLVINKPEDAEKCLKDAAQADPNHHSSQLVLGMLYEKGGYRIPSLLAFCRFLILEPDSQRSASAVKKIRGIVLSGASIGDNPKNVTITVDPSGKTDEGDFNPISMALSLLASSRFLPENKGKTEIELAVDTFGSLFAILSESKGRAKQSAFAWNYYRPYFADLKARGYVEPFCYYIFQSTKSAEISDWLRKNDGKVNDFLAWSKSYRWSAAK